MFHYFNSHWTNSLKEHVDRTEPLVIVTVVKVEGSAPRESSCRMFVLEDRIVETIGGGNLEQEAIKLARTMLNDSDADNYRLELYGLGPALQQCCGGAVTLAFEKIADKPDWLCECLQQNNQNQVLISTFDESQVVRKITDIQAINPEGLLDNVLIEHITPFNPEVVVFGAGHVGTALVDVLQRLPFKINWVDERSEIFSDVDNQIRIYTDKSTVKYIDELPENALNIVMTHSHELDEEICYHYLKDKEFKFLGLIGSKTKRARFLHRLRDRGIDQQRLSALTCPIGVSEVTGSSPPEIAIAVAAQLLSLRDQIKLDTSLV